MSLEHQLIPNDKNNEKINVIKIKNPKFIDIGTEDSIRIKKKYRKFLFNDQ